MYKNHARQVLGQSDITSADRENATHAKGLGGLLERHERSQGPDSKGIIIQGRIQG